MRKIAFAVVVLLVGSLFLGSVVFAENTGTVRNLTLEQALSVGLENSSVVKKANLDLEDKERIYKDAQSGYDDLEEGLGKNNLETKKYRLTVLLPAKMNNTLAEKDRELAISGARLEIEKAYFTLLGAENSLKTMEKALEAAKEQLRIAEKSFEQGMVSRKDVLDARAWVASVEGQYFAAQSSRDIAVLSLNKLLGWDLETKLVPVDTFEYTPTEIDLTKSVEKALAERIDLQKLGEMLDYQRELYQSIAGAYPGTRKEAEQRIAYEKALIDFNDAKNNVVLQVKSNYLKVKGLEKSIEALAEGIKASEEGLRIMKLRYDAGLETGLSVINAEKNLLELQDQYSKAVCDHKVAYAEFLQSLKGSSLPSSAMMAPAEVQGQGFNGE
jgi:outer membrane protein TolC